MKEYWQRSFVTGNGGEGENRYTAGEDILHRRGEDPVVLACRRNRRLAGCDRISVETSEAFQEERHGLPVRRRRDDIPKDEKVQWTYGDIPD